MRQLLPNETKAVITKLLQSVTEIITKRVKCWACHETKNYVGSAFLNSKLCKKTSAVIYCLSYIN